MTVDFPRLMIAAPRSGEGKTTVVCGLLGALLARGLKVASFKCGPDFIDPLFHREIIGAKSGNLDLFFTDPERAKSLFAQKAAGQDISVIEGVMGYYDGLSGVSDEASSYRLAQALGAPAVLVLNARGASLSLLATLDGFRGFRPDANIRGLILNQCSKSQFELLRPEIERRGIRALGYLAKDAAYGLESRHLGLVTAAEVQGLREKMRALADAIGQTVDLDGLIELARQAQPLEYAPLELTPIVQNRPCIAVARDRAFCFYYAENLELLRALGAELRFFSPLADSALPEEADALYLGGGYPELYTEQLEANRAMRVCIRKAAEAGLPMIAECGGFMYLQNAITDKTGERREMCGVIDTECRLTDRLGTRFGYITLRALVPGLLCGAGEQIGAHEFHYSESDDCGASFEAVKPGGRRKWDCAYTNRNLYAGYPHMYFYSNIRFAENLVSAASQYKEREKCRKF